MEVNDCNPPLPSHGFLISHEWNLFWFKCHSSKIQKKNGPRKTMLPSSNINTVTSTRKGKHVCFFLPSPICRFTRGSSKPTAKSGKNCLETWRRREENKLQILQILAMWKITMLIRYLSIHQQHSPEYRWTNGFTSYNSKGHNFWNIDPTFNVILYTKLRWFTRHFHGFCKRWMFEGFKQLSGTTDSNYQEMPNDSPKRNSIPWRGKEIVWLHPSTFTHVCTSSITFRLMKKLKEWISCHQPSLRNIAKVLY